MERRGVARSGSFDRFQRCTITIRGSSRSVFFDLCADDAADPQPASPTRLLLDAARNRGAERKKKMGPPFGPDVGRKKMASFRC